MPTVFVDNKIVGKGWVNPPLKEIRQWWKDNIKGNEIIGGRIICMDETEHIMQYFAYAHLSQELQNVSRPFCDIAEWVVGHVPRNRERTVALRKLLEAKDAAVRAKMSKE